MIIEDEHPGLELMKYFVRRNKNLKLVGAFTNPRDALTQLRTLSPDVIFTDIRMPYFNGIEFAKEVRKVSTTIHIVFTTAHEGYAYEAFGVDASNYILKPISQESIDLTVERLLRRNTLAPPSSPPKTLPYTINCFGGFEVYGTDTNTPARWPTAKSRELFAYLTIYSNTSINKWTLCETLWPNSPPHRSEHNLYSTINRTRRALKDIGIQDIIKNDNGHYTVSLSDFNSDISLFDPSYSFPHATPENIDTLILATTLYQTGLFGDLDYPWAIELKENYSRQYSNILKSISQYHLKNNRPDLSKSFLLTALSHNPTDEEATEHLMTTYFQLNNKSGIITAYKNLEENLTSEFATTPSQALQTLLAELIRKM